MANNTEIFVSERHKFTFPLSGSLSLRVYSNTRPYIWQIANLQKGLILVNREVEIVGEGTGFGVPVVLYSDERYFSGSSKVYLFQQKDSVIIRKEFFMDMVPRKKFRGINLHNQKLRILSRYLAKLYQSHRRFPLLLVKRLLLNLGFNTSFERTTPIGKVIIVYTVRKKRIYVESDFRNLKKKNLKRIFLLNEHGSKYFRRYSDTNNTLLVDRQIGAWEKVEAEWASITDLQGRIGFRLWNLENSILRRGREYLKNCLDWIGLDYEVDPESTCFDYMIDLIGV
ncbi:MAG: hypothetical protein JSW01_00735 [Candidatus Bathyarchaeota archaeon]|nr:MAG: hypothetical protein JSW01_00735 [Candidatus Bathyarchaeota archaeon]